MSKIIVISAIAKNNVIGKNKQIPWHIKEDFKHFKDLTMGHPIIMGSVTYESLPVKPLPGRINIVLNQDQKYHLKGAIVKNSFADAIDYCRKYPKIFIIGGRSVYELGLEVADELELTQIAHDYQGDTYFPQIDFSKWELIKEEKHEGDDGNGTIVQYSFCTYRRK